MTDIDDLDLTPQQRSALRRADENPEHLTDYDAETLGDVLTHEEVAIQRAAAGILSEGAEDDPQSFVVMEGALVAALSDGWLGVRRDAAETLSRVSGTAPEQLSDAIGPLIAALDDEEDRVRESAAEALGKIGASAPERVSGAVDPLIVALDDEISRVRKQAAESLGRIGEVAPEQVREATGPLVDALDDERHWVRREAAEELGRIGGAAPEQVGEATGPLIAALNDENEQVRTNAASALRCIGSEAPKQVHEATGPLVAALDDEDESVREQAALALGQVGNGSPEQVREATGPLIAALDDESEWVRAGAAKALGYVGPAGTDDAVVEATDRLCTLLSDDAADVRMHSAIALGRLHAADRPDSESLGAELEERFDGRQGPTARLAECLNDDQLDMAVAAAFALFRAGSTNHELRVTARHQLREGLTSSEHRRSTARLVAELAETGPAIHPMMRDVFADDDAEDAAVRDLVPDLIDLLDDSDEEVRRRSCRALGHLDADAAVDDLERLATEADDEPVREAAREALDEIGESDDSGATTDAAPEEPSEEFSGGPSEESPGGPSEEPAEAPGGSTTTDSAPDPATAMPEPSDGLSYDVIEREATLGRGAADVYEARISDGEGSRRVVLKEPRFAGGLDADTREGFLDEARYWALVADHPHVVDLVAWGDDPHPWLVAEYLDGGDLSGREAELDEALWTCARIADALHEAHHLGLRHLDLKPENVLLRRVADNPWDVPKVSDWGLARFQMEHSGRLSSFTPRYGAPEQFLPDEFGGVDNRTDLYQLGLVLYELITGEHPFPDRSGRVATERLRESPRPPTELDGSLPSRLDDITGRLLAPRPVDRYDSAAVVRNALDRLRTGEGVGRGALADRADLYASALEYARKESLRECRRWAEEMQKFVANNPVEDAAYETVREDVASFVDDWFAGRETAYGSDHDLVVGGDVDLASTNPELHHDIADMAEAVRRLYLRSA